MQAARRLSRRAHRERERAFLVEGPRAVRDALERGYAIKELFVSDHDDDLVTLAHEHGVPVVDVDASVMRAIADTITPQGVVAVVAMPHRRLSDVIAKGDLVLVLVDVRDPGNAGTLLRSATAAGASAVVFTKGAVDPFGPKTVRAAAGTTFHVPVVSGEPLEEVVDALRAAGFAVCGADAHGDRDMGDIDMTGRIAIVVGNEGWGIDDEARSLIEATVRIPMPGPAESLNVGIAGSILLFEAVRQRRLSSGNHE
ncbi:MAG: TrmH family RNA methyltransferase [Actinomycetota bacterium]